MQTDPGETMNAKECNLNLQAIGKISWVLFLIFLFQCGEDKKAELDTNNDNQPSAPGILFFGDSLTAGLGLDDPEKSAWPALIGKRLSEEGLDYEVWNGGLSGDTTSGGLDRLDYSLKRKPEVFVLELGANDSMRGVSISEIEKNLLAIIDRVESRYPNTKILLIGLQTFPNLGLEYKAGFDRIYPKISRKRNIPLVPFLLEGVAGDRSLNQDDGIHPTEEGHAIMAKTVYPYLKKLLKE